MATVKSMLDSTTELCGQVPTALQQMATIVKHEMMARNTWRIRLRCPNLARQIIPGQFFMVRVPDRGDPLLGRPFALFDVYDNEVGEPEFVEFGYVVVGKMTSILESMREGDRVEVWGPLGNGFPPPTAGHLVIVAGGIGQTPFLAVIREALRLRTYGSPDRILETIPSKITLCYGVRSVEYLAGIEDFRSLGIDIRIATDNGTAGHRGFVTDLLKRLIDSNERPDAVYCCGPEPMMNAVANVTNQANVACWLSLETPMACGYGACFSCVAKIRQEAGEWDYRRVCVEGPVFRADQVVFAD
jgi:dihydroorotate dehydrogenase electron transfer subunit